MKEGTRERQTHTHTQRERERRRERRVRVRVRDTDLPGKRGVQPLRALRLVHDMTEKTSEKSTPSLESATVTYSNIISDHIRSDQII